MNKKQVIKSIAFILIIAGIFVNLSNLLIPAWVTDTAPTLVQKNIDDQKEKTVDVAFIGSSQLSFGIFSMRMAEKWNIASISCPTSNQPVLCSLFYIRELQKKQDLKLVVFDVSMLYEPEEESRYRQTLDSVPLSMNKLKTIIEHEQDGGTDSLLTYLMPISMYHSRWSSLGKSDFTLDDNSFPIYKGNVVTSQYRDDMTFETVQIETDEGEPDLEISENNMKYFDEIVNHCKDNNLELLLIKTPKGGWTDKKNAGVNELASKYGLTFLDFNTAELLSALNLDFANDWKDWDHLNSRGAIKLSDYLGEYISSQDYGLMDVRDDYYNYKNELKDFNEDLEDAYLVSATGEDFLERMKSDRYEVIIQASANAGIYSEVINGYISNLGVDSAVDVGEGTFYIHIKDGKINKKEYEAITYKADSGKKITFEVAQDQGENIKSIVYVGDNKVKFSSQCGIMVIDKNTGKIVCSRELVE